MDKEEKKSTAPVGVLAEISGLLAAITPEQFVAPTDSPRRKGMHAVGMATDDIKRLATLRASFVEKHTKLVEELDGLAGKALGRILTDPFGVAEELQNPDSPAQKEMARLEQFHAETRQVSRLLGVIEKILWLEVRRQHPDLTSHAHVCICDDWSLCWKKDEDEGLDIAALLGLGSLSVAATRGIIAGLMEPLKRAGDRKR